METEAAEMGGPQGGEKTRPPACLPATDWTLSTSQLAGPEPVLFGSLRLGLDTERVGTGQGQPSARGSTARRTRGVQGWNFHFPGGDAGAGELPRRSQAPRRGENEGRPAPIQPTSPQPAICLMTQNRSGSSHQPAPRQAQFYFTNY